MLVLNPYIKRDGCANNPEKHIITKIGEHIPSSKSTIWAFNHKENKHALYCRKYCRKNFCSSLRQHATNILNFEKKRKMLPLTKEELKLHRDARKCYILLRKNLKKAR